MVFNPPHGIGLEQFKRARTFARKGSRKPFPQDGHQTGILLNGQHRGGSSHEQLGQGPQPWTHLKNPVGRLDIRSGGNTSQLITIMQEVLPQRLRQLDPPSLQQGTHFIQGHDRILRGRDGLLGLTKTGG